MTHTKKKHQQIDLALQTMTRTNIETYVLPEPTCRSEIIFVILVFTLRQEEKNSTDVVILNISGIYHRHLSSEQSVGAFKAPLSRQILNIFFTSIEARGGRPKLLSHASNQTIPKRTKLFFWGKIYISELYHRLRNISLL